ncbi:hypothetical protein DOT_2133 [Desulfosporosinus sp. OT]|nr:hypothetical protein DOT_2133 [Desulfosporosinus sp. OT]
MGQAFLFSIQFLLFTQQLNLVFNLAKQYKIIVRDLVAYSIQINKSKTLIKSIL